MNNDYYYYYYYYKPPVTIITMLEPSKLQAILVKFLPNG